MCKYEDAMQMLNVQIGLDGFEKVRKEIFSMFIMFVLQKCCKQNLKFRIWIRQELQSENENKWIKTKRVEKFSSDKSSNFNCVKLQHSMDL